MDDVADQVVLALAKFTSSLSPAVMRPRVVFGRDFKACAASEALFHVVNRCGARGCGCESCQAEGSKLCTASEASIHVAQGADTQRALCCWMCVLVSEW